MKILLIRNHFGGNVNDRSPYSLNRVMGYTQPLGIAYIASALVKAGYVVEILDSLAERLDNRETAARIAAARPDIAGITAMTPTVKGALEAARLAKEYGAITVMGGPQLSALPRETLAHPFVDFGVIGEGETPMVNFVRAIENKKPLHEIGGLVFKDNREIKINQPGIENDLNSVTPPALKLLNMGLYNSILSRGKVTAMISSRGCPYQCGFCAKQPSDRAIRFRDPKLVVDEMEAALGIFGSKEIMFYDDTLTLRREHIFGICNEILSRNLKISWIAPTRVNHVTPDLLKLMRRAGCRQLRYGVESGNQSILDLMRKKITLQQVRNAFRWSREAGIETLAFFIIAYPGENKATIKETISFAKELQPDMAEFLLASPLPGTDMFDRAVEDMRVDRGYWRDFTLLKRDDPIPYFLADAEEHLARAYRSFFFRPSYLIRRLKAVHSYDALNKHLKGAYALLNFRTRPKQRRHA